MNASALKAEIQNNASELKTGIKAIKASHDKITGYVRTFDACIKKVEQLTLSVPDLVQTVSTTLSENSSSLKKMGNRITDNRDSIIELQDSFKQMSNRTPGPAAYPAQQIQASGDELSIMDVMRNQARFSTAIQLRNAPAMIFS